MTARIELSAAALKSGHTVIRMVLAVLAAAAKEFDVRAVVGAAVATAPENPLVGVGTGTADCNAKLLPSVDCSHRECAAALGTDALDAVVRPKDCHWFLRCGANSPPRLDALRDPRMRNNHPFRRLK